MAHPFGLRLRSCGENPVAAESLGVNVYTTSSWRCSISGGLAGLGGGFLAIVANHLPRGPDRRPRLHRPRRHDLRQLACRAACYRRRPLRLHRRRPAARWRHDVHALLLLLAVLLVVVGDLAGRPQGRTVQGVIALVVGVARRRLVRRDRQVPPELSQHAPYVTTLLVLAFASQRLRMPAADGQIYRKGEGHSGAAAGPTRRLGGAARGARSRLMERAYAPYSQLPGRRGGPRRRRPHRGRLQRRERRLRRDPVRRVRHGLASCTRTGGGRLVASSASAAHGAAAHAVRALPQLLWENGGPDCCWSTPEGVLPMREVLPQAFGPDNLTVTPCG